MPRTSYPRPTHPIRVAVMAKPKRFRIALTVAGVLGILALVFGAGHVTAGSPVDTHTESDAQSQMADREDAALQTLIEAGWYGDPTDRAESLYSPDTCRVVLVDGVPETAVALLIERGFTARPGDGAEALYAPACR